MENTLEKRLRADRLFVEYLCKITGKSASALATGADMASTTLNRFVSKKAKSHSTLKDSTIEKIAHRWGLDYLELIAHRKKIEYDLNDGKSASAAPRSKSAGFKEPPARAFAAAERDPLMDQIMGATYETWFHADYQKTVAFDRLPRVVHTLYARIKAEPARPSLDAIKKRAADMLAVMTVEPDEKR